MQVGSGAVTAYQTGASRHPSSIITSPKRMPFVSTVTNSVSKSTRTPGHSRLASSGNALMFERKRHTTRGTPQNVEKRASTQLTRLPNLEEDEKRSIMEAACRVRTNRNINIDSYLANMVGKSRVAGKERTGTATPQQPKSSLQIQNDLI